MDKIEKILIINYEYPPLGGGGGVATYELAKEWAKIVEVDVLTSSFKGLPRFEISEGVNIYRCPILFRKSRDSAGLFSMFSYLVTGFFKGASLCRKRRYSVINTQFAVPSGPLGYMLSKIFGLKNILSIHGGDIYDPSKKLSPHKNPFFKRVVKFVLNHCDHIVAQSSNTKDNCITYYKPKTEISIIPLAFTMPQFKPLTRSKLNFKKEDFLLIAIGRLVKRKAFDDAIKIIAHLKDSKIKLLIVGDGPEREYLENCISKAQLQERIKILGYLSYEEKFQYLNVSDMMLMTSLHEGFGIIFMEAMYCGLPIACTNNGGQVDFIKDEINGLLFNVADIPAGVNAVKRLYSEEKLFRVCSKNNKKEIKKFYSDTIADDYMQLFGSVLGVS
ncbi:MAG: glycosyltransferase family 4 protein [Spirochaetes bacterium]|jgi:glycosyltransferase involved in cell wall biosynthesis|nr:glycosyltransferase family 4 protein [Spirochaetota bacterium]